MEDSWEDLYMKNVQRHIEEHGVSGLEEFFKGELGRWKNVEINIGIIGMEINIWENKFCQEGKSRLPPSRDGSNNYSKWRRMLTS